MNIEVKCMFTIAVVMLILSLAGAIYGTLYPEVRKMSDDCIVPNAEEVENFLVDCITGEWGGLDCEATAKRIFCERAKP